MWNGEMVTISRYVIHYIIPGICIIKYICNCVYLYNIYEFVVCQYSKIMPTKYNIKVNNIIVSAIL